MEILSAKNKNLKHHEAKDSYSNNKNIADKKSCIISLRINTLLYNTLHNYLLAMHNVSDYKFSSISDVLRHIITQIEENGFSTDQITQDQETEHIDINIRVIPKLKLFWKALPDRNKRQIMEKAIIAFIKSKIA